MMSFEFEGETERDAVVKACSALKQTEGDLDYTVIDEGSPGLFGLGARPVRIRARAAEASVTEGTEIAETAANAELTEGAEVGAMNGQVGNEDEDVSSVRGPAPEKAARAREVAEGLAERMGLACVVSVRDEDARIVVVLDEAEGSTAVVEMLGKSRPPAVPSFQFLLNKIVNRFPEGRKHILVEVPSVPKRAPAERKPRRAVADSAAGAPRDREQPDPELDPSLVALGHFLADRARSTGRVVTVHPMLPGDRRAIHQTIMGIDGVRTISTGDGLYRRMHVVTGGEAGGGGEGGARGGRRRRRRGRGGSGQSGSGPGGSSGNVDGNGNSDGSVGGNGEGSGGSSHDAAS